MYRSILVPLDGSGFGEQALPLALSLARRAGAALHLTHVHVPLAPLYVEGIPTVDNSLDPRMREQEKAYLEAVRQRLAGTGVPVQTTLLDGPIAEAVQEQVQAAGIDLVVMTTHGRGPLSRFWLGSVADELLRRLPVPMLVSRPREATAGAGPEPVFKQVLIPLDGSSLAEQVLEPAVALGVLTGAEYTLFRAIEPTPFVGYDPAGFGVHPVQAPTLEQQQTEALDYLERVASRLRAQGHRVQVRVDVGQAPSAILQEAGREGIDLIAVATHGRRGLGRLLLGSVADKILRGATTPVLVYRPLRQTKGGMT